MAEVPLQINIIDGDYREEEKSPFEGAQGMISQNSKKFYNVNSIASGHPPESTLLILSPSNRGNYVPLRFVTNL